MHMIVGLGNPGSEYAGNRHNIGAMAVDEIARRHGFSPFKSKFQGQVADGTVDGTRVLLLKPQTFMNRSGDGVATAAKFYKIPLEEITVIYDELDLAPGKLRVKSGGGAGGHNGLRSIDAQIGNGYHRVRLGIGHPGHRDRVHGHVLGDFAKADQDWLDDLLRGISDGAPELAKGDTSRFMNAVALRTAPPRASRSGKSEPAAKPAEPETSAEPEDDRSTLQKLVDRFR